MKVRFLFLVLLAGLLAGTACKCGDDEKPDGPDKVTDAPVADFQATVGKLPAAASLELAAWLPADLDMALLADEPAKAWAWLKGRPWFAAMRESSLGRDLAFAGPLYRLSTARHRLAGMSPVDLQRLSPEEFFATPFAVGMRSDEEGVGLIMVKQVDLKLQALDRLAEVFAQMKGDQRLKTHKDGDLEYRSAELGQGSRLYFAVYSNLLLLSNREAELKAALKRSGAAKAGDSLAGDAALKGLKPAAARLWLKPAALGAFGPLFLPGERWAASFRLEPRPGLDWRAPGALAKGAKAGDLDGKALAALLPADCRFLLARTDAQPGELLARLLSAGGKKETKGLEQLSAQLGGQLALAWLGREAARPLPAVALLLKLRQADEQALEWMAGGLFEYAFGRAAEPKSLPSLGGRQIFVLPGEGLRPAFAAAGGWLILASSPETLTRILATSAGQEPSLADQAQPAALLAQARSGLWYADAMPAAQDLRGLMGDWIQAGQRYSAADVEDGLGSFFKAAAGMGRAGGGWKAQETHLTGALEAM